MEDIKMSIYGLNNMNMFGMNSMGYGGMGMFNMGGINLFGNMFGSSIFTNCDGSYNYNAMAGFGVGQVLMNIGGMAISQWVTSSKANSQENLAADIGSIDKRIAKVIEENKGYGESKTKLVEANEQAGAKIKTFEAELTTLKDNETKAKDAKDAAYANLQNATDENKTELQTAYNNAVRAYNEAKDAKESKEKEIEAQQAIIDENKPKIEELDEKIQICEDELKDLQAERDAIQAQLNEKILDKADGTKIARTTAKEFSKMYNFKEKDFNTGFNASNVSKSDLRYIISQYRTSEDTESKNKWAEIMKKIYNDPNLDSSVKSDNIRAAYKLMCE